jgi:hypothetical protein
MILFYIVCNKQPLCNFKVAKSFYLLFHDLFLKDEIAL